MYPKAQWTDSWLVLSSQLDVIFSQSGIPVRLQLHVAQSGFPITLQLDAIFTHSGFTVRLPFDQTFTWSGILVRLQLNVTQSGLPVTLQLGHWLRFCSKTTTDPPFIWSGFPGRRQVLAWLHTLTALSTGWQHPAGSYSANLLHDLTHLQHHAKFYMKPWSCLWKLLFVAHEMVAPHKLWSSWKVCQWLLQFWLVRQHRFVHPRVQFPRL